MPEQTVYPEFHHRGRLHQVPICLGKLFRGFIFEKDWKVLPLTAIIAGLVSMVVRSTFFITMEGSLMGSFALVCVCIWNGCFNSIQAICRERGVIKREHRSGMHITSYMVSHMIYQALLCLAQTLLTVYICKVTGVQFPVKGFITPLCLLDICISMFLVTYASDMLSLLISSFARTTTAAMTVMPFLLIFQLVFSGGFFSLPQWAAPLSKLTISRYGLTSVAALADYNNLPMATSWNSLVKLKNEEIVYSTTVGELVEKLTNENNEAIKNLRAKPIDNRSIYDYAVAALKDVLPPAAIPSFEELGVPGTMTVGDLIDRLIETTAITDNLDMPIEGGIKIGSIIDIFGEDAVRDAIQRKTAQASYNPKYERSKSNIYHCWKMLLLFILLYSTIATIALEFIDKDKR